MQLLAKKRALIFGVLNRHSLAYSIASRMHAGGAEIALSYQHDKMRDRIQPLAEALKTSFYEPCDVSQDNSIESFFNKLKTHWDCFDILVHSIAYAPPSTLKNDYLSNTQRQDFQTAHDVSSYSFTALARHAKPMLRPEGALLTLSYLGAERAMPHYNVMGVAKASLEASVRYLAQSLGSSNIRVNAISAAPCRTVSASGIYEFNALLKHHEEHAPLKEPITSTTIGDAAVCLCSDLMRGVTGEIIHVDGGFHAILPTTL